MGWWYHAIYYKAIISQRCKIQISLITAHTRSGIRDLFSFIIFWDCPWKWAIDLVLADLEERRWGCSTGRFGDGPFTSLSLSFLICKAMESLQSQTLEQMLASPFPEGPHPWILWSFILQPLECRTLQTSELPTSTAHGWGLPCLLSAQRHVSGYAEHSTCPPPSSTDRRDVPSSRQVTAAVCARAATRCPGWEQGRLLTANNYRQGHHGEMAELHPWSLGRRAPRAGSDSSAIWKASWGFKGPVLSHPH